MKTGAPRGNGRVTVLGSSSPGFLGLSSESVAPRRFSVYIQKLFILYELDLVVG